MPDRSGVLYADSSALVKLAVNEAETDALRAELEQWQDVATSVITEIEVTRAVAKVRASGAPTLDEIEVSALIWAALEIELTAEVRDSALRLQPASLRALDCIHVASALSLGDDLAAVLTYDKRMQFAAASARLEVLAPA